MTEGLAKIKDIIKSNKNTLKKIEVLIIYIAYTVYVMKFMYESVYVICDILSWLNRIAKCLLAVIVIKDIIELRKISTKKTILTIIVLIVFAISSIVSDNKHVLYLVMFVIAFKNIEFDKFIKYDFMFKLVSIVLIVGCYYLNFTDVYIMESETRGERYSMGFGHPNVFAMYVVSVFFEYIYLKRENQEIKDIVQYIIIGIILFFIINYFSDSRTSLIILTLLLLFIILNKIFDNIKIEDKLKKIFSKRVYFKKILKIIVTNLFVILSLISILVGYLYSKDNELAYKINEITSTRVSSIVNFMNEYDITLFGNQLETVSTREAKETGEKVAVLDNGYVRIILEYGIIIFIFMCVSFQKFLAYYINKKEKLIVAIMVIFLLSGFMENYFFLLQYNVFLLLFSEIFYSYKNRDREDKRKVQEIECEEEKIQVEI